MIKLAIEGINGAGKTPTISNVVELCEASGLRAAQYAPYHLVREQIQQDDIYELWEDEAPFAVSCLLGVIKQIERDATDRGLDVLIFDRHWATAYTQAFTNPRITGHWGDNFVPTVLLTSPSNHLQRLAQRGYTAPWLQTDTLDYYRNLYEEIYKAHPDKFIGRYEVASSTQPLEPIAQQICTLINKLTEGDL